MQINKLIDMVRELHPCVFSNAVMLNWLSELDGQINSQVHLISPADLKPYEMTEEGSLPQVQLLVPYPFNSMYVQYMLAQLSYYEGEYEKYQNAMQMYNLRYTEYVKWVCENIAPANGEAERMQYYLSAYAIAVKHGYKGSEEEWIASLVSKKGDKGDKGDKGEPGSGIHYVQDFLEPDTYNNRIANVQQDGVYGIESSDYIAESTGSDDWADRPTNEKDEGFALIVSQFNDTANVQIAISETDGKIYTRKVMRLLGPDGNHKVQLDWKVAGDDTAQPAKERRQPVLLAVGDSICRGGLNGGKGFVGELGFAYVNKAVDGAAFTRILPTMSDEQVICNQLIKAHEENVHADIVIVEGGANDYKFGGELQATLDAVNTLIEELYARYPLARKFFLLSHKTRSEVAKGTETGVYDWTTTQNMSGYTQTELFDEIKELCKEYGIEIIDVFGQSELDTNEPKYVTDVNADEYKDENGKLLSMFYENTATDWVAGDGLHPLAYGYSHGYLPIVSKAIFGEDALDAGGGLNLPLLYENTTTEEVRWIDTKNAFEVKSMLIVELTAKATTTNEADKPGSGSFRSSSSTDSIYPYSNYALARSVKELLAMQYDRRFTSISVRGNDGFWTTIWQVRTTANTADATPYMQTSGFNQNITGVVIGDAAAMGDTRHMGVGSTLRVWGC